MPTLEDRRAVYLINPHLAALPILCADPTTETRLDPAPSHLRRSVKRPGEAETKKTRLAQACLDPSLSSRSDGGVGRKKAGSQPRLLTHTVTVCPSVLEVWDRLAAEKATR